MEHFENLVPNGIEQLFFSVFQRFNLENDLWNFLFHKMDLNANLLNVSS